MLEINNVSDNLVSLKPTASKQLGARHVQNEDQQNSKAGTGDTNHGGETVPERQKGK
jgi:hypothetical protein